MTVPGRPPYAHTPAVVRLVAEIVEALGRLRAGPGERAPLLNRENRIRTVHASLAIENNTLSLEQVRAICEDREQESATNRFCDQVTDQVSDQVRRLLEVLGEREMGGAELMSDLGLSHRPTFRKNYVSPALSAGWVARTEPDSPRSPAQRYRRTGAGRRLLARIAGASGGARGNSQKK